MFSDSLRAYTLILTLCERLVLTCVMYEVDRIIAQIREVKSSKDNSHHFGISRKISGIERTDMITSTELKYPHSKNVVVIYSKTTQNCRGSLNTLYKRSSDSVSYTHLKELKERLELKKIDDMKCLPCEIDIDDYFDDTVVDDRHLPYDVMNIVKEYDGRTYLMLTKNTDVTRPKLMM